MGLLHIYDTSPALWESLAQRWLEDPNSLLIVSNTKQRDNFLSMVLDVNNPTITKPRILTVEQLYSRFRSEIRKTAPGHIIPPRISAPELDALVQHVYQEDELTFSARQKAGQELNLCLEHDLELSGKQSLLLSEVHKLGFQMFSEEPRTITDSLRDPLYLAPTILMAPTGSLGETILRAIPKVKNLERYALNTDKMQILEGEVPEFHDSPDPIKTRPAEMVTQSFPDAYQTAFKQVATLLHQGVSPEHITLVSWDEPSHFIPLAHKYNIPVEITLRPSIMNSPLLGLLYAICESPSENIYDSVPKIEEYRQTHTTVERLIAIYEIGRELLAMEDEHYTDYNIVEGYLKELAAQTLVYATRLDLADYNFQIPDALDIVKNIQGEELIYKTAQNSVTVTSLAGVASNKQTHLIFPGFSQISNMQMASAFNTLTANQSLQKIQDLSTERILQNALASTENTLIIHSEINRDGFDEIISPLIRNCAPLTHKRYKKVQSTALTLSRQLEDIHGTQYTKKTQFSVTELEDYLRCPLGWYVRKVIRPVNIKPSDNMSRGNLLHATLEKAYLRHPITNQEEIIESISEIIETENMIGEFPILTPTELEVYKHFLTRVATSYAGATWPFTQSMHEKEFSLTGILPNYSNIRLTGKVDRIDVNDQGHALVLDYKHNKGTSSAPSLKEGDLQLGLYPAMIRALGEYTPIGFMYLNIVQGKSSGLLSPACTFEITDDMTVKTHEMDTLINQALALSETAIAGIHNGDVFHIGESCTQSWCPHHLISHTLQEKTLGGSE